MQTARYIEKLSECGVNDSEHEVVYRGGNDWAPRGSKKLQLVVQVIYELLYYISCCTIAIF